MASPFLLLALALAVLAAAAPLAAEELRFGVDSETTFDNNIFSDEEEEVEDLSLRITPWMEVEDRRGSLTWNLTYRPAYEAFLDTEGIDGWDHDVEGTIAWRISPRTTLELSDRFRRSQSVSRFNDSQVDDLGQVVSETLGRRSRSKFNDFEALLTHQLSADQQLFFVLQQSIFDLTSQDRESVGAVVSYRRQVSERLATGLTGSIRRLTFEGVGEADDTETDFFNLSGLLEYSFTPSLQVSFSGGPALVDSGDSAGFPSVFRNQPAIPTLPTAQGAFPVRFGSCPATEEGQPFLSARCTPVAVVLPPADAGQRVDLDFVGEETADETTRITFFADIALTKTWEHWALNLGFRRQDSSSGSSGVSTINDTLSAGLSWDPAPRWNVGLSAAWSRERQATDSVVPVVVLRPDPRLVQNMDGSFSRVDLGEAAGIGTIEAESDLEQITTVLSARVNYQLSRRLDLFGRFFFIQENNDEPEDTSSQVFTGEDFSRFSISFGVSYHFDPFRF